MRNKNMMFNDGGNQIEMAYQMLSQSGAIGEMPFEEFAQLPPEQIQQLVQQVQQGGGQEQGMSPEQAPQQGEMQMQQPQQGEMQMPQAQNGDYLNNLGYAQQSNSVDTSGMGPGAGRANAPEYKGTARGRRLNNRAKRQDFRATEEGQQQAADTAQTAGNLGIQAGITGANMLSGAMVNQDESVGSTANVASNVLSRTAQGASLGMVAGPWGALIGAGVGAIGGGIESSIKDKEYQAENVAAQGPKNVGALGTSLMAKRGGYSSRRVAAEDAYAKSLANQPLSLSGYSGKLSMNGKIYAAGQKIMNDKSTKQKRTPAWMEDQTTKKYNDGGTSQASMEAEGDEVILGDLGNVQTFDGTGVSTPTSAGGVLNGPDHGSQNAGGSEGIPMDAQDAYIGSKRKTIDGSDISVKKGGKAPANSVAGKMKKVLKDIETLENSGDRYAEPIIEQRKQQLSTLRDLAEIGKFSKDLNKLIKKEDIQGAKEMMTQMPGEQAGAQNDQAMADSGGFYRNGGYGSNLLRLQAGGNAPTSPNMEGLNRLQQNRETKRYGLQMDQYNAIAAERAKAQQLDDQVSMQNYMGTFNAQPSVPQGQQFNNVGMGNDPSRNLNMDNQAGGRQAFGLQGEQLEMGGYGYYQSGGSVPSFNRPTPPDTQGMNRLQQGLEGRRYNMQMDRYNQGMAKSNANFNRLQQKDDTASMQNYMDAFNAQPQAPQGQQFYNSGMPNDPSRNLNMNNEAGAPMGFGLQGQEMQAYGGYGKKRSYQTGGFANGQQVSFKKGGFTHSGTVNNYNAATGDFDLT